MYIHIYIRLYIIEMRWTIAYIYRWRHFAWENENKNRQVPSLNAAIFDTECDVVEGQTLRESNYCCSQCFGSTQNKHGRRFIPLLVYACMYVSVGRDISVDIASRYGLDGPGIESRWGRNFPHLSKPALGPTQPPIQRVQGLSQGWSGQGVALTTQPHLAPRLRKE